MKSDQGSQSVRHGRHSGWFRGTLISVIMAGGVCVVCFLLFGLAAPGTGHADFEPQPLLDLTSRSTLRTADSATDTVFLPLVARTPSATSVWYTQYYSNQDLQGAPVRTAEKERIDFNWGTGRPTGLPSNDHFSIRWTGSWDFEYGIYTFFVYADDGVRLWLDNDLLINYWSPGQGSHQATRTITTAGQHSVKVEYFEQTGDASIRVGWRRTDLQPEWQGNYFNNASLQGTRLYAQTDSVIEFNWGAGCPQYLDCDNFSIHWQATPVFDPGTYRFYIYADDGYQLYVKGAKVKEGGWTVGQAGAAQYDMTVSSLEYRVIQFNFNDRGGRAEARLLVQKLGYPQWTAQYYSNKTLSGTPVKTQSEETVFYDWGTGKPITALPSADSFSVRWTGERYFHAGFYRFGLFADDGVRVWVDGELLVDQWHDGSGTMHSPYTYLATGYHDVKIEYYENTGDAEIRFWWE